MKIFIVEDDTTIADYIKAHLEKWGYEVKIACDFKAVTEETAEFCPHLILLDIGLPYMNGYHWCTQIRKTSDVPIIFISSASDNMNIVMAINMGGDDFIAKPFDLDVLTAKIGGLLRRAYPGSESNVLEHRGVRLNLAGMSVEFDGNKCELTKNELKILQALFEKPGKVVPRDMVMQKLWNSDRFVDDNTLSVNVNRLRKKLEEIGLNDFIGTKKGVGYIVE